MGWTRRFRGRFTDKGSEEAWDGALEDLGYSNREMDKMKSDFDYHLLKVKESMREQLQLKYKTHDELNELLKVKVPPSNRHGDSAERVVLVTNGSHAAQEAGHAIQMLQRTPVIVVA